MVTVCWNVLEKTADLVYTIFRGNFVTLLLNLWSVIKLLKNLLHDYHYFLFSS